MPKDWLRIQMSLEYRLGVHNVAESMLRSVVLSMVFLANAMKGLERVSCLRTADYGP